MQVEYKTTINQRLYSQNRLDKIRREDPHYYLFVAWSNIKQRCYNPKHPAFRHYGERGIRLHDDWINYESFKKDILASIGDRPTTKHSLDRFPDNDGDYRPGNVRWATPHEQALNKRAMTDAPRKYYKPRKRSMKVVKRLRTPDQNRHVGIDDQAHAILEDYCRRNNISKRNVASTAIRLFCMGTKGPLLEGRLAPTKLAESATPPE